MNNLLSLDHSGPTTPDVKPSASSNDLLNFGVFSDPVPTHQAPDPFQMNDLSNSLRQIQRTNDLFQNSEVYFHIDPPVMPPPYQMDRMHLKNQQQIVLNQQRGYNPLASTRGFNLLQGNYNQFNFGNKFTQQAYNPNMYGNLMNQQMGGSFPSNTQQSHVGNTMGQNVMGNITPWSANQNMSEGMAQQQQL
ncbi:uncharacterized protein LOC130654783 isoform X2 [Hydractinia symbiolongicarpus]|nr:uncharacterized protein LOC130654783 isoform X2 [Hydractinia symbiolongicarpus]XP_057313393.1 uncharacterized protein LOC130654783 isoform X2 [Hydractinia symbiolongicarpus]